MQPVWSDRSVFHPSVPPAYTDVFVCMNTSLWRWSCENMQLMQHQRIPKKDKRSLIM